MTTAIVRGRRGWSGSRDRDGHRTYKIRYLVENQSILDGPAHILEAPGLPQPGDIYAVDNDGDPWATIKLDAEMKEVSDIKDEPNRYWEIELTASTVPDGKRCKDQQIDNPLLIPQQVSGSFVKYQEEGLVDRFLNPIVNTAFEPLHGPQNEWDKNRPQVKIQQNVAALQLALFSQMVDTVNIGPLWGLPPRCVKLSNVQWERKFYGQCFVYYSRTFEFDINFNTFDRYLLDEGTKMLHGHWDQTTGAWVLDQLAPFTPPNPKNPQHFDKAKDRNGENMKVILHNGLPAGVEVLAFPTGWPKIPPGSPDAAFPNFSNLPPGQLYVQRYYESDFTQLAIPLAF